MIVLATLLDKKAIGMLGIGTNLGVLLITKSKITRGIILVQSNVIKTDKPVDSHSTDWSVGGKSRW